MNDTFTSGDGHISLNSGGSIHTPKFYVNQSGNAGFSGVLTFGTGTLDVGAVNVNTITNSSITLTNLSGANNLENKTAVMNKLLSLVDTYLYISRNIDPEILRYLQKENNHIICKKMKIV